jgi:cyclopropane-fatty-acyl-phospholipid synthase
MTPLIRHDSAEGRRRSNRSSVGPTRATRLRRLATHALLRRIGNGQITVIDPLGSETFGDHAGKSVVITVRDLHAYDRLVSEGGVGLGRSYADGQWDVDDLTALLRIALRNLRPLHKWGNRWHQAVAPISDHFSAKRPQDLQTDAEDIRAHYDLGNQFFELILDETLMYSAAYFANPDDDLETASEAKLDLLNQMLDLKPADEVLEIGTGWGGYAVRTAERHDVQITTTTISREQHEYAVARVSRAGLADRVAVLDQDYRLLAGVFDKAVSIEMIEAVDWREYDTFFEVVGQRLRPGGRLAMQAILIGDDDFQRTKNKTDFIKAEIFPGGCLPSVRALQLAAAKSGLKLTGRRDIGRHYSETLRRWRRNLHAAAESHPEVDPISDKRFVRLWDFYFSYCEAGFEEGYVTDKQLLFEKR